MPNPNEATPSPSPGPDRNALAKIGAVVAALGIKTPVTAKEIADEVAALFDAAEEVKS